MARAFISSGTFFNPAALFMAALCAISFSGCEGADDTSAGAVGIEDTGPFVFAPSDTETADVSTASDSGGTVTPRNDSMSNDTADEDTAIESDSAVEEDTAESGPVDCSDGTPCPANALCNTETGFCDCKDGFEAQFGGLQCTDIDECEDGSADCQENSTCKNLFGSYTCNCDDGYYNAGIGVCADFDECELDGSCPKAATCTNLDGSFECACPVGTALSADESSCDDIDECVDSPCPAGEQCVNTNGAYSCVPEGTCVPQCGGLQCGADGCGGSCGTCGGDTFCQNGLCVSDTPVSGTCTGAPVLNIPGSVLGTTTGQTDSFDLGFDSCTGFSTKGPDVAYTLSGAAGETITVTLDPDFDGSLYIVTGCDDVAASCLIGSDGAVTNGTESVTFTMPSSGTAYAIIDSFYDDSKGYGAFTLTAAPPCTPQCGGKECGSNGCGGTCGLCPIGEECNAGTCTSEPVELGDTCETATLSFAPFTINGTTSGATNDYELDFGDCTGLYTPGADVVYQMFAYSGETYKITLDPDFFGAVYVLNDCADPGASCLAGADENVGSGVEELLFTPSSTDTYYLVVDSFSSLSTGDFTLTVAEDTACVPSCGGNECGDDGCGGSCGTCTGGGSCIGGSCFGGTPTGQWNTCGDATYKSIPFTLSGTTVGNTNDYDPGFSGCTGFQEPGPDAAVEVLVVAGKSYVVTLDPDVEGAIYIVSDCDDLAGSCLAGSDEGTGAVTETIEFTAEETEFVFIIVDSYTSTSSGAFTLSMSEVTSF